jgi:single-strand DNA-binding protein
MNRSSEVRFKGFIISRAIQALNRAGGQGSMANTKLPNLNKVLIAGNLVKDPELRYTTTGAPVVNFKIASNKKFRDGLGMQKEEVCYIGVVAWQKLAESCSQFLQKGSAVLVEGELRSRLKENDDGTKRSFVEIKASQIQFLDKRNDVNSLEEESVFSNSGEKVDTAELEGLW